jgi:hypothetical protein
MLLRYPLLVVSLVFRATDSYIRKPCTRDVRAQFQFPDCYVPFMDTSLLISEASFLMAHDAGTGYIHPKTALHWFYSKTQVGTAYEQLQSGARALDVRPKLLSNGTVILQHGIVDIHVTLETLASDAVRWCNENDDELVLLLTNNLQYETAYDDDDGYRATSAMKSVYDKLGVAYYTCDAVYGLTVGDVMEMGTLSGGGYMIALDRQDYYGSFCGKMNWVESQLVTCYPGAGNICINSKGAEPLASLKNYVLASANNDATDNSQTLGPSADLETYPFNEIQAIWQVDASSVIAGVKHLSSLLDDNKRSNVNREMAKMIHSEEFVSISLFLIDNVALNGNAIFSILRTQCGQSIASPCGSEVSRPRMMRVSMSRILYWSILLLFSFFVLRGIWRSRGHDMLLHVRSLVDNSVRDER